MAIGGAGGCIPVFVLPARGSKRPRRSGDSDTVHQVANMLPYARWLDYCTVGYLVFSSVASHNMSGLMATLERVSEAEAAIKLAALHRVRSAFVFRRGSTVAEPSAPEYILSETCAAARRWQAQGSAAFTPAADEAALARCTLG
jgi:hypothetical protein